MSDRSSQCLKVLQYMRTHGSITNRQAVYDLGVMRLSGRIYDLKDKGYNIRTVLQGEVPNYATYYLEGEEEDGLD